MWWHEVVNLDGPPGRQAVAVTHCPLTGSSLAFDRRPLSDVEFGVSGLLFQTNLIMYDRTGTEESLWPQMLRGARCGPSDGAQLPMVPIVETTWRGWKELHPDTRVVTENTGHDRSYHVHPYGAYGAEANGQLLFPVSDGIDPRRPPKERIRGIPDGTAARSTAESGGIAFPFGELDELGEVAVVSGSTSDESFVLLWERSPTASSRYHLVTS